VTSPSELRYPAKHVKGKVNANAKSKPKPKPQSKPSAPREGRKEKALITRRRMLRAAYDSFCERGYAATTMDVIAERAGVAVQTLYFTFHTKGAILEEVVGAAITGFERWDPRAVPSLTNDPRKAFMDFHPWFAAFDAAPTQAAALAVFVEASVDIFTRVGPLASVMTTAASSDPQMRAAANLGERRRVEGFALVIDLLAKRGRLRRGVSARKGTDILLALLSAEVYDHLALRRGWSTAELRKWMVDVLAQQLLP
jgi:AcrR family transcriptional regulator